MTSVLPRSLFQMITRSPERRPDTSATIPDTANCYSTSAAANRKAGSERIVTENFRPTASMAGADERSSAAKSQLWPKKRGFEWSGYSRVVLGEV